jgi:hypothetical protein
VTKEVRIPVSLDWANVVKPGDTLIVALAESDSDVAAVATQMQARLDPIGVKVIVLDNVRQLAVVRPEGGEEA